MFLVLVLFYVCLVVYCDAAELVSYFSCCVFHFKHALIFTCTVYVLPVSVYLNFVFCLVLVCCDLVYCDLKKNVPDA
jgi:hypothetical protein